MEHAAFRYQERLRVRWVEVDAQQIVFNAHYLTYIDVARGGYWRALAMPYVETMAALGGDLFMRKSSVEYLASARYGDELDIGVRCQRVGTTSLVFNAAAFRDSQQLMNAELVYVFADASTRVPKPVPAALRKVLQAYEAGEPMVGVRIGDWQQLGGVASAIRTEVFVEEQKVPVALEWDEADAGAVHAVAFNGFGTALGTGRLIDYQPGVVKIGRVAVRRNARGCDVGTALLNALLDAARQRGAREAILHAQRSAEAFYAKAGFTPRGAEFDEAGIAHIEMRRAL